MNLVNNGQAHQQSFAAKWSTGIWVRGHGLDSRRGLRTSLSSPVTKMNILSSNHNTLKFLICFYLQGKQDLSETLGGRLRGGGGGGGGRVLQCLKQ